MSADIVLSARALAPLLRAQAAEGERLREPTAEAVRLLKANQLLTLLLPKRFGGEGLTFTEYGLVQIELAKGDLSVCWLVHAINANFFVVSTRPDPLRDALFGDSPTIISGGVLPLGRAREVGDGYIVDGAWHHCTAIGMADWIFGGVTFIGKAGEVLPGVGFAYMRKSDVSVEESWFVTGLQGTGSDTAIATSVHVPSVRMVLPNLADAEPERFPITVAVRTGFLAVLVGGVMAMLELVVQRTQSRPQATWLVLYHLSKVEGQIEAAMLTVFEILRRLDDLTRTGGELGVDERARIEARTAMVMGLVHEAVDACIFLAGSSALVNSNPLSVYWRDLHMALRHINVPHVAYVEVARDGSRELS